METVEMYYYICDKEFLNTQIPTTVKWNQGVDKNGNLVSLGRTVRTFSIKCWEHPTLSLACFTGCAHPYGAPRHEDMTEKDHLEWKWYASQYGLTPITRDEWLLEYETNGWKPNKVVTYVE